MTNDQNTDSNNGDNSQENAATGSATDTGAATSTDNEQGQAAAPEAAPVSETVEATTEASTASPEAAMDTTGQGSPEPAAAAPEAATAEAPKAPQVTVTFSGSANGTATLDAGSTLAQALKVAKLPSDTMTRNANGSVMYKTAKIMENTHVTTVAASAGG